MKNALPQCRSTPELRCGQSESAICMVRGIVVRRGYFKKGAGTQRHREGLTEEDYCPRRSRLLCQRERPHQDRQRKDLS